MLLRIRNQILLSRIVLAILGLLCFQKNLQISLLKLVKICVEIMIRIMLNMWIAIGGTVVFAKLILPIHSMGDLVSSYFNYLKFVSYKYFT